MISDAFLSNIGQYVSIIIRALQQKFMKFLEFCFKILLHSFYYFFIRNRLSVIFFSFIKRKLLKDLNFFIFLLKDERGAIW